jgi:outer membrane protein OmpA-like peptidoglycan-associated protein
MRGTGQAARGRFRAAIAIAAAGALLAMSPAPATGASPVPVPVAGRTVITADRDASGARVIALVHGIRRVAGGSVLYYSMGTPAGSADTPVSALFRMPTERRWGTFSSTLLGNQVVYDMAARKAYTVLVDKEGGNALASPTAAWDGARSGQFQVFYTVLPPIPASVTTMDVSLGFGDIVHDVPVQDGALEPAVDQTGPILLGTGWPKIDLSAVASADHPELSIFPLESVTADLGRSVVTTKDLDKVTVDLSADVLFAVDQATLTPAAQQRLRRAAATINQDYARGAVEITGYTDSTASDTYNVDLSRRRAQAVATALRPLVTVPGVDYSITGKGEADPVADNGTPAGRKQNRRVTISFTPKERTG